MAGISQKKRELLGFNPQRTEDLFALTRDGDYIIAQDVACQHEYVMMQACGECDTQLLPIAQINRAFQGLSEIVAVCSQDGTHYSFIFDISNDVYQKWWKQQMGTLYDVVYDGPPREPDPKQRYFD